MLATEFVGATGSRNHIPEVRGLQVVKVWAKARVEKEVKATSSATVGLKRGSCIGDMTDDSDEEIGASSIIQISSRDQKCLLLPRGVNRSSARRENAVERKVCKEVDGEQI